MKKVWAILFSILTVVIFTSSKVSAVEDLESTNYKVEIVVEEDGRIHVKETIDMLFNYPRHGIYVVIPQYQTMDFDGVTSRHYWPVTDIKVEGNVPYDIEDDLEDITIRLGSEDYYADRETQYIISYTYNSKDYFDAINPEEKNMDYLFFNIIGAHHDYRILNSEFSIEFPKALDIKPEIQAGYPSKTIEYTMNGTRISGQYSDTLDREGITILAKLPQGYFNFPKSTNVTIGLGISAVVFVLVVVIKMIYGKKDIIVDSVEFTAPRGLNSADVGYIYRGYPKTEDMTSLIIYWASKGLVTIEEVDKKNMILTKIGDLDLGASAAEKLVFNSIFGVESFGLEVSVTTKELKKKQIGGDIQHAMSLEPGYFSKDPERKLFERKTTTMKIIGLLLLPFVYIGVSAILSKNIFMVQSGNVFLFGYFIPYLIVVMIVMMMGAVGSYIRNNFIRLILAIPTMGIVSVTLYIYGIIETIPLFVVLLVWAMLSVGLYLLMGMRKRTEQGKIWYGQVLGLRNFINVAEKERLEMLVDENPEYFYDVLPYAYVLGVTDVWSKKFASINVMPPSWYYSSNMDTFTTLYLWSSLNRNMNSIQTSMKAVPASKSGGSFGSGGFSGGGGGGFSGGGFGGSGGGGW